VIPELDLPDYHKLAKAVAKDKVEVEEKDVEDVVLEVRKMRAHKDLHKDEAGNEVEHDHKDESHNHAHDEIDKKSVEELPELTDEYVATLGDFKSVDEFLTKVRENVTLEKEQRNIEKRRNEILQVIVDNTKGEIPEILIESETDRMLAQMKGDVAQMGGKFDEYLSYIKKTETDLRNEWRTDAEKRAKIQIVLNTIAKEHKIEPEKDLVEKEATRLTEMYSDADMERARDYVYQLMQNEEVLKFLEK
jgi:FKBP-type peptidyl-prolyl cis-trans isomerase (trigger factor)